MRTIYISEDYSLGAAKGRHRFSFSEERPTPSGVEFDVALNGEDIGVARGIDTLTPRGRTVRLWEVQLNTLYVDSAPNLSTALRRVLPHAKRLIANGSAG